MYVHHRRMCQLERKTLALREAFHSFFFLYTTRTNVPPVSDILYCSVYYTAVRVAYKGRAIDNSHVHSNYTLERTNGFVARGSCRPCRQAVVARL